MSNHFVSISRASFTGEDFSQYDCIHLFSARCILGQIVEGLLVLHKNSIMHRDISMGNVLLSRDRQNNVQAVTQSCLMSLHYFDVHVLLVSGNGSDQMSSKMFVSEPAVI